MHAGHHWNLKLLVALAVALVLPLAQAADSWTLTAAEWSRPRSGAAVIAMPGVAEAVRAWQAAGPEARLQLLHPGGEEGSLWAAELRDWLIALGIPSNAIELVAGTGAPDRLEIRLAR